MKKISTLHRIFRVTILVKGIDGLLDVLSGLFLVLIGADRRNEIIPFLVRGELVEDPNDIIANYLLNVSHHLLPDTQTFIILYLAIHGFAKIGIALSLWGKNVKLYKLAGALLAVFIIYQLYRLSHTHSVILLVTTLFDAVILFLLQREYRALIKKHKKYL